MVAEMALMDLHFAAAGLAPNPPGWIQRLELCAENDRLPNKEMLDRKELETEVEVPLPEMGAPAPAQLPTAPVNNRLEGNALETINAMIEAVDVER
jgi:hypothetical protein